MTRHNTLNTVLSKLIDSDKDTYALRDLHLASPSTTVLKNVLLDTVAELSSRKSDSTIVHNIATGLYETNFIDKELYNSLMRQDGGNPARLKQVHDRVIDEVYLLDNLGDIMRDAALMVDIDTISELANTYISGPSALAEQGNSESSIDGDDESTPLTIVTRLNHLTALLIQKPDTMSDEEAMIIGHWIGDNVDTHLRNHGKVVKLSLKLTDITEMVEALRRAPLSGLSKIPMSTFNLLASTTKYSLLHLYGVKYGTSLSSYRNIPLGVLKTAKEQLDILQKEIDYPNRSLATQHVEGCDCAHEDDKVIDDAPIDNMELVEILIGGDRVACLEMANKLIQQEVNRLEIDGLNVIKRLGECAQNDGSDNGNEVRLLVDEGNKISSRILELHSKLGKLSNHD